VFTGWSYAGATSFLTAERTESNQVLPMKLYPEFHDTGTKSLLRGTTLPANQSGEQDLELALDNIFAHPNVGPFIATRLIQQLVTSNPSPQYVARVAARFDDNGAGVRGDLKAVVRAILIDPEARPVPATNRSGKLKEPLLRLTQFWRAYSAQAPNGSYSSIDLWWYGEGPLQALSVFNFFSPFYAPPGEIRDAGLVAPELEIATEYRNTIVTNTFFAQCFNRHAGSPGLKPEDVVVDLGEEAALAKDPRALASLLAAKLLGGEMSSVLQTEIIALGVRSPALLPDDLAAEATYLVASSPEFAVQR
jgi:uncharacterized protein (DUF1800 family)